MPVTFPKRIVGFATKEQAEFCLRELRNALGDYWITEKQIAVDSDGLYMIRFMADASEIQAITLWLSGFNSGFITAQLPTAPPELTTEEVQRLIDETEPLIQQKRETLYDD